MSLDNSIYYCSFETEEQIRRIIESGPHSIEKNQSKHIRWHMYIPDVHYDVVSLAHDNYDDDPEYKQDLIRCQGFVEIGEVNFRLTSKYCAVQDARFIEILAELINIPSKPVAGLFNGEDVLIRFDGKTVQIPDKHDFWSDELLSLLKKNVTHYPIEYFPGPLII